MTQTITATESTLSMQQIAKLLSQNKELVTVNNELTVTNSEQLKLITSLQAELERQIPSLTHSEKAVLQENQQLLAMIENQQLLIERQTTQLQQFEDLQESLVKDLNNENQELLNTLTTLKTLR